ncbi:MAG: PadR family transcriptional regulator [Anaerolineae bacterium]|nr:PadR family transcriptional regulator [Anaerolineae bacterium]
MSPANKLPLTIEWSLLGFLAERPMHGYEIHQRLSAAALSEATGLSVVWHIKQSQLYAILARLEEREYITYTLEPQETRPPRKVYTLTPDGEAAFQSWMSTPVERGRDFRLEFLAKVYFAHHYGTGMLHTLFSAQRAMCHTWRVELQKKLEIQELNTYEALVYRFRLGQIRAMLDWLDESEGVFCEGFVIRNSQFVIRDS